MREPDLLLTLLRIVWIRRAGVDGLGSSTGAPIGGGGGGGKSIG
jgi:hypothetical protein